MTVTAVALTSCCGASKSEAPWIVDRFDDIKVIRYEVPGFEQLPLAEKELVYYLAEAAKCGRDILFDQNFKYNLAVRRTLETVYENYRGDRSAAEWKALEKYLKKVWFANGIHHHYSNDKFVPEFTEGYLLDVIETIPEEKFGDLNPLRGEVCKAIFDPALYKTRLNQTAGEDLIATSSNNYYEGVTQAEVEKFYADMVDHNDPEPISYGLNSKLVKENGVLKERVWKVGGMYSPAIEKIVYWLEKAQAVATEPQKSNIAALIEYYKTGDLREFDRYNIGWVKDTVSNVDFVNGFIEDYGDPLGRKASWEGIVNFMDKEACHRTEVISDNAQWFEDHSPVAPAYRKEKVKGVSAKVITVAMLGGDCYPATPIGINVRSTVATYANVHDELRKIFSHTQDAKAHGYKAGDFSYNTGKLRCPVCDGTGVISLDVQFLPDVEIPCPACHGSRYAREADDVKLIDKHGRTTTLPRLMDCDVHTALDLCKDRKLVRQRLQVLQDLGLGYLTLGEETPSLSGGEAQRLKLASEMERTQSHAVFVFDEPTIGLHPLDVQTLLGVFRTLIDNGATVIVIEHDLDVIRSADYIVDMGPGGGEKGGRVVAAGTPAQIKATPESVTGRFL